MSDDNDPAESLLAAVQQWAQRVLPAPPSGHGGPECQWCPLCQLASVLRGEHPEITDRMAEAGTAIGNAVRLLVDSATARASGDPERSTPPAAKPRPRPRVERIVLDVDAPDDNGEG